MIVKILGVLDILAAAIFWLSAFFNLQLQGTITLLALYLIAKGTIFLISKDFASILDLLAGFVLFASIQFTLPTFVVFLTTIYLLQKGVFSLL